RPPHLGRRLARSARRARCDAAGRDARHAADTACGAGRRALVAAARRPARPGARPAAPRGNAGRVQPLLRLGRRFLVRRLPPGAAALLVPARDLERDLLPLAPRRPGPDRRPPRRPDRLAAGRVRRARTLVRGAAALADVVAPAPRPRARPVR